jgi:hypothetical protein
MKTTLIGFTLAAAGTLLVQPVIAAEPAHGAAGAPHVAYAPESPAAAFERMLAPRVPGTAAPLALPAADPLDPHFHAALWSDDASVARVTASASLRTANVR